MMMTMMVMMMTFLTWQEYTTAWRRLRDRRRCSAALPELGEHHEDLADDVNDHHQVLADHVGEHH